MTLGGRIALTVVILTAAVAVSPAQDGPVVTWTAQYRVAFNGSDYFGPDVDLEITDAALSGDGTVAYVTGFNTSTYEYWVLKVPSSGGAPVAVIMPPDPDSADLTYRPDSITTDSDGSVAFVATRWYQHRLFRITGGAISEILDLDDYPSLTMATGTRTRSTSDGAWLYFNEDRDDLWRIAAAGGTPERVLDDAAIIRANGRPGWAIGDFDISGSGEVACFILNGYRDVNNAVVIKYDMFCLHGGGVTQLSDGGPSELHPAVSSDGTTVVFEADPDWKAASPSGAGLRALVASGYNHGGQELSADGRLFAYFDSQAHGGTLLDTTDGRRLDLMPPWSPIYLSMTYNTRLSEGGSVVGFTPGDRVRWIIGRLGSPDPAFPGPSMAEITMDPAALPMGAPVDANLFLDVDHPLGSQHVVKTSATSMLDGVVGGPNADMMIYFPFSPNDSGTGEDATAGDGIWSADADMGGQAGIAAGQRIRLAAEGDDGHVVVTDIWYPSCGPSGCWIFADGFESGGLGGRSTFVP